MLTKRELIQATLAHQDVGRVPYSIDCTPEAMEIIQAQGATPAGVVIALDRQERGRDGWSAIQEVEQSYGIPVATIVKLEHLIDFLVEREDSEDALNRINAYRDTYGV